METAAASEALAGESLRRSLRRSSSEAKLQQPCARRRLPIRRRRSKFPALRSRQSFAGKVSARTGSL